MQVKPISRVKKYGIADLYQEIPVFLDILFQLRKTSNSKTVNTAPVLGIMVSGTVFNKKKFRHTLYYFNR